MLGAMQRYNLKQIDLMVATHAHADHIGGADEVILGTTVTSVLDSQVPNATKNYEDFLKAIKDRGVKYIGASPGQKFDLGGGAQLTVLAPIQPFFTKAQLRQGANEPNANSVVTRLDYGDFSMLFTGDAEAETEARMISQGANLKAKVLKVGHHGSRYATSTEFLNAVKPEAAVISCGSSNNYGHPTQETLTRIKSAGAKLYRTDLQGEIKITSSGKGYQITTEKTATEAALFTGRGTEKAADTATNTSTQDGSNSQKSTQTTTQNTSTTQSGQVIGNKNSKIYHLPGCPGYNTVSEKNQVKFNSAAEAEAAGYTLAKNCKGGSAKSETKTTPSTNTATETKTQSTTPSAGSTGTTSSPVIGNKNSKIYHLPGCPGYNTVSEKNQVKFNSASEAEAAGYTRAKNCKAGETSSSPTPSTKTETKTTQTTPTPDAPLATAVPATQATSAAGKVIGNKNSKKYHLPGCPSYDSVSEKNRVYFDTEQDAIKAGYTKAGNCNK